MAAAPTEPGPVPSGVGRYGKAALCGVALVAMALAARMRPLRNADLLWQIPSGELIAAMRHRLTVDLFSQRLRGAPLLDHEPASELVFFGLYRAGGFASLWWASVAIVVCVALGAFRSAGRIAPSASARLIALGALLIAVAPRLDLRAEWAAFGAIALAHALRREGDGFGRKLAPVAVAAIAAPFHALALLVALVPLAHALEAVSVRRARDATIDLAVFVATPLVVGVVSPAAVLALVAHLRASAFSQHLIEYYSPLRYVAASMDPSPLLAIALSLLASFALFRASAKGARRGDALLVLMLVVPGLVRSRFTVLAPLGALPWVVAGVALVLTGPLSRLRVLLRFAVATVTCACVATVLTAELGAYRVVGFDLSEQPVESIDWLVVHRPNARLFHPFNFGAYVLFRRFGSGPLIDSRAGSLYPDAFAGTYYGALEDQAQLQAYLAPFDTVLLHRRHRGTARARRFLYESPAWKVLWEDQIAVVFGRR